MDIFASAGAFTFNVASAIVVLLLGFILAQIAERVLLRSLAELESNLHIERMGLRIALDAIVSNTVSLLIYIYTVYMALRQLQLINVVFYIVLAIASSLIALSFVVGVRDFFPNLMAGFSLRNNKGKRIQHKNSILIVSKVYLLETQLHNEKHDVFYIPNAQMKHFF